MFYSCAPLHTAFQALPPAVYQIELWLMSLETQAAVAVLDDWAELRELLVTWRDKFVATAKWANKWGTAAWQLRPGGSGLSWSYTPTAESAPYAPPTDGERDALISALETLRNGLASLGDVPAELAAALSALNAAAETITDFAERFTNAVTGGNEAQALVLTGS